MKRPILILVALLALAAGAVGLYLGQRDHGRAGEHSAAGSGPSSELMGAMHRMHEATNGISMTGDIDRDFVALMVPHHRSAVEMAQAYLRHGKDPQLRRLSESVIASQEAEIRRMRARDPEAAAGSNPPAAKQAAH